MDRIFGRRMMQTVELIESSAERELVDGWQHDKHKYMRSARSDGKM